MGSRCSTIAVVLVLGGCGDAALEPAKDAGAMLDAAEYEPPPFEPPAPDAGVAVMLSETGLYEDIVRKELAPDLIPFTPAYALWSDGADKQRWLRLPKGTRIDTRDMDHWDFPVGTMVFKEFARDGKRLETRLIMRTGPGTQDYFMGAFAWSEDESDARLVVDGAPNVRGTDHDVPRQADCRTCHNGEPGRILGFSAVQQPHLDAALVTVTNPPYQAPGDAQTSAALGYLHANCGHCHNENGSAWPDTDMDLRLRVSSVAFETPTERTTIDVPLQYFDGTFALKLRVAPGDPAQSGVSYRMSMRGAKTQMPPLATKHVDDAGLSAVGAWISSLR